MRVALVLAKARAQWLVSDAVFGALRFNGKSAMENGVDYRELVLEEGDGGGEALVRSLVAFAPHVVVYDGSVAVTNDASNVAGFVVRRPMRFL